jgi:hypothetical protein
MNAALTPRETQEMIRGFANHERFCRQLTIRNKEGVAVPYVTSPGGQKLNRAIRQQEMAGRPVRIVVLKASQVWMSSSCATQIFRRVPFFPGRRALVLADIQAHADLVFQYYEQYIASYRLNPFGAEWNSAIELPALVKDTEQHLRWANGSSILVATANNIDIARSAPFNWVQLSEAAFYRSLGGVMTGLMQRVPLSPDSGVLVETTANGEGGDFYDLWKLAESGKSGWLAVFFAWWEHPENVLPVSMLGYSDRAAFQRTLSRLEIEEQQRYNLTLEQLAWRRHKIETDCEGRLERFQQEHPGNSGEAFLRSGRTIFDLSALARMPLVQDPIRGDLEVVTVGIEKKVQFRENGRGDLAIYRMPRKGGRYVIGVDHAQGIDPTAKEGRSDPDYCSATVLDADTGEQVAKLRERFEPRPWAELIYWLGRFYGWAYLVPERKALGAAVIGHLIELDYPVELMYSAEREPSDRRPPLAQELGYETDVVRRAVLVSALDTAIRQGAIQIHDAGTLTECRQFVRKPNGREEGTKHDDDVFSAAFAVVGLPKAARAFAYRDQLLAMQQKQWKPQRYGVQVREDDDD